jgi:hypothetical protein
MRDQVHASLSDAGINRLAEIVHGVVSLERTAAETDAHRRRLLADAFELAEAETAGQPARVKARDMALRAIASEIASALRLSDRSVQRQIGDAAQFVSGYPATLDAYEAGAITKAHVQLITELGEPLPPEARSEFEQRAVARAEEETAGRLRGELRSLPSDCILGASPSVTPRRVSRGTSARSRSATGSRGCSRSVRPFLSRPAPTASIRWASLSSTLARRRSSA